jgi:hypothetical protein
MSRLASMVTPNLIRLRVTDTIGVQSRKRWDFAEPAAHERALKAPEITATSCEDLTHGSRVQFVDQLAVAFLDGVQGVCFEAAVVVKLAETEALTPVADDVHVVLGTISGGYDIGCGSGGEGSG